MTKTVCITLGYRSDLKICKLITIQKAVLLIMYYVFTKKKITTMKSLRLMGRTGLGCNTFITTYEKSIKILIKIVEFYTCLMVKKYINTTTNMALYLIKDLMFV